MGKVPKENNPRHYVGLVGFNHDYHQGYNFLQIADIIEEHWRSL